MLKIFFKNNWWSKPDETDHRGYPCNNHKLQQNFFLYNSLTSYSIFSDFLFWYFYCKLWWHSPLFFVVVLIIHRHEVKLITYSGIIRNLSISFNVAGIRPFIMGVTFLVFVGTGGELTTKKVFTTISLFTVLSTSIIFLVRCFFLLYEAFVAIKRIQVSQFYFTIIL